MDLLLRPFSLLLEWLYSLSGSYGLAIILFGLIFKVLLFPVSLRGRKSMLDMSRLSDKQKELQQKYGQDRQRYSIELQNLYTTEGVKPSGGCLWTLLPMPVLLALFAIINAPFTHMMKLTGEQSTQLISFMREFLHIEEKVRLTQLSITQDVFTHFDQVKAALPDVAAQITANGGPIDLTFFGLNLSAVPKVFFWENGLSWGSVGLFLLPIISAAFALLSMLVNMRINKRVLGGKTSQDAQNKQMMFLQPVISLWIGFTLPAALAIYWTANAVFAIIQEYCSVGILKRHVEKTRVESEARAIAMKEKQKLEKQREAEQKKKKAEEAQRIKMERKLSSGGISESRVGMRAYAKGRTFDESRYPTTPYHDPDDIIKEQRAAWKATQEEAAQSKKGGKKKSKSSEEKPTGMILNGKAEDGDVRSNPATQQDRPEDREE